MAEAASTPEADRQLPVGDEIFLDHVGHFVRDPEAASRALARAGFAPTPVSVQSNPDGTPIGTGNVTAMFDRGYVEVLFKTADTPLGREFEAALAGHAGVHLAAFSVADAEQGASPADRGGLCHAAAGAVSAAGRDRTRAGHRRLHRGAARARRDGGRPHPVPDAPHREHGLAAALARRIATALWA